MEGCRSWRTICVGRERRKSKKEQKIDMNWQRGGRRKKPEKRQDTEQQEQQQEDKKNEKGHRSSIKTNRNFRDGVGDANTRTGREKTGWSMREKQRSP